jgi:hypothetical protein
MQKSLPLSERATDGHTFLDVKQDPYQPGGLKVPMAQASNPTGFRSRTRDSATLTSSLRGKEGTRSGNGSTARSRGAAVRTAPAKTTPRGRPYDESRDWKQLGLLAVGIAAGAAVGAGAALLFTSQTGPQRRAGIARKARHLGHDAEQQWEDLAFALKEAARSTRDRFRHRRAAAAADETDADD